MGLNGRDAAAVNVSRFEAWIAERDSANDWTDYTRGDKLNRSEVATECGFALSVLRQNPAVKSALDALESRLRDQGILKASAPGETAKTNDPATLATDRRIMSAKSQADQRVKALEEQNAALRAENRELRDRLRQLEHVDAHLAATGRLLHS